MDIRWGVINFAARNFVMIHHKALLNRKRITNGPVNYEETAKIQAVIRRYVQVRKYKRIQSAVTIVQSWIRHKLARRQFTAIVRAVKKLQTWHRMWICVNIFNVTIAHIVKVQRIWRKTCCRANYIHARQCVIIVQSCFRRARQKNVFGRTMSYIVMAQRIARGYLARKRLNHILRSLIRLQAIFRMANARRRVGVKRYMATVCCQQLFQAMESALLNIADIVEANQSAKSLQYLCRSWLQRQRFLRMRSAARRLQRCVRAFLRNLYLTKCLLYLYGVCSRGQAQEMMDLLSFPAPEIGDISSRSTMFMPYSCHNIRHFLSIRNRGLKFCTILHIAAAGGNLPVMEVLQPGPADILALDSNRNNTAHFAVLHPSVEMCSFLSDCLEIKYSSNALRKCGLISAKDSDHPNINPILVSDKSDTKNTLQAEQRKDAESSTAKKNFPADNDSLKEANEGVEFVLKQGWLQRKTSNGRWKRVWVVLTTTSVAYFHNPSDTNALFEIALRACVARREHPVDFVITVYEMSNFANNIELLADSERELRSWLIILNAMENIDRKRFSKFSKSRIQDNNPVHYINTALRRAWLNETNKANETPLLVLARFKNRTKDGALLVPTARIVQVALWLIENGCDINIQNNSGQTALHVSIRYGNIDLARCLVAKGADVRIKNSEGNTVLDMCTPDLRAILMSSISAYGYQDTRYVTPNVVKRHLQCCSYLTLNFHKHSQAATKHRDTFDALTYPYLSISVYNSHRELLESSQNMPAPILRRASYVWWGCSWEMQTPLEFIDNDCFILIELRNASSLSAIRCLPTAPATGDMTRGPGCAGGGCIDSPLRRMFLSSKSKKKTKPAENSSTKLSNHCIAWSICPVNLATINSGSFTYELQRYPIVFPPLPGHDAELTNKRTSGVTSDGSFLETSVVIAQPRQRPSESSSSSRSTNDTSALKDMLQEYRLQPNWVHLHLPMPVLDGHSKNLVITGLPKTKVSNAVINISRVMGLQTVAQYRQMRVMECRAEERAKREARLAARNQPISTLSPPPTNAAVSPAVSHTECKEDVALTTSKKLLSSLQLLQRSVSISAFRKNAMVQLPDRKETLTLPRDEDPAYEPAMSSPSKAVVARMEKLRRLMKASTSHTKKESASSNRRPLSPAAKFTSNRKSRELEVSESILAGALSRMQSYEATEADDVLDIVTSPGEANEDCTAAYDEDGDGNDDDDVEIAVALSEAILAQSLARVKAFKQELYSP